MGIETERWTKMAKVFTPPKKDIAVWPQKATKDEINRYLFCIKTELLCVDYCLRTARKLQFQLQKMSERFFGTYQKPLIEFGMLV